MIDYMRLFFGMPLQGKPNFVMAIPTFNDSNPCIDKDVLFFAASS